jgi:hypothetical protein
MIAPAPIQPAQVDSKHAHDTTASIDNAHRIPPALSRCASVSDLAGIGSAALTR